MSKLGRGLSALINTAPDADKRETGIDTVALELIRPNKYQPRTVFDPEKLQDLAQSLKENGMIQPIIVTKHNDNDYELIAGERRLQAAKLAGLKEIPVIIRQVTKKEQLVFAIIENIQREDLNAIDEARAFQQLYQEFNLTHAEISDVMGKDRATISNALRLLKLNTPIQDMIIRGELTSGHARAILSLEEEYQMDFANHIKQNNMNVRQAEESSKKFKEKKEQPRPAVHENDLVLKELEDKLSSKYKTKVKIQEGKSKGKIIVNFKNQANLYEIINQLLHNN